MVKDGGKLWERMRKRGRRIQGREVLDGRKNREKTPVMWNNNLQRAKGPPGKSKREGDHCKNKRYAMLGI